MSEEILQSAAGGFQSDIGIDITLADIPALYELLAVLKTGATKYARDNWRLIEEVDHLNHMVNHGLRRIQEIKDGEPDGSGEDHTAHAQCRAHMAMAMKLQGGITTDPEKLQALRVAAGEANKRVRARQDDLQTQLAVDYEALLRNVER